MSIVLIKNIAKQFFCMENQILKVLYKYRGLIQPYNKKD